MSQGFDDFDEQMASQGLAKFFLEKELPPRAAEDRKVKELVEMLNSPSQFSTDVIGHKCLELYEEEKAKKKRTLRDLDGKISLSADMLRSGKKYKCGSEYLCLTAFFIDENWELNRWVLNFSLIGDQVDNSPSAIILGALKDWDIESKINTITMVNHARYDETVETVKNHLLGKKEQYHLLGKKVLPLDGILFGVHCCGDVVKLMMQDAYEPINDTMEKIGKFYSFKGVKFTWYDRSCQLKEALILRSAGHYSSSRDMRIFYDMTKKRWSTVSRVCDFVFDVHEVVFPLFEMGGYSTSNIFLHHLQGLQSYLMQRQEDAIGYMINVINKMLERFNKYMKEMYLVLAIASVMDPRFKMKYIEFSSSKFEGDQSDSQVTMILKAIHSLYEDYTTHFPTEEVYLDQKLLIEYKQFLNSTDQPPKSELHSYLEEPVIAWSPDFKVLSWWKAASAKYPTLSRMARDLLAIPVTVAISDDAFYMKQRKADYNVIASGPELMNAFMCIRSWLLHY